METIYDKLKNAGIDLGCHESDLYAMVTPESKKIISNYEYKKSVTTFISNTDGHLWFDIPFAYKPFWDAKAAKK